MTTSNEESAILPTPLNGWYVPAFTPMPEGQPQESRRSQRIKEAVLELNGVIAVRVWELPGRVEIGVQVSPSDTPSDVLNRVQELAQALREGEETWEVGLLAEA